MNASIQDFSQFLRTMVDQNNKLIICISQMINWFLIIFIYSFCEKYEFNWLKK